MAYKGEREQIQRGRAVICVREVLDLVFRLLLLSLHIF